MALLGGEVVEGLGDHLGVVLVDCVRIVLQILEPLPPLLEGGQLSTGGGTGLLQRGQLRPQFVYGDESLGLLVLVGAPPPFNL